jgi:autotransporter-associated beta strand protein
MRITNPLLTSLVCLALGGAPASAALSYWDSNGSTPGAGDTPSGVWDTDLFWSIDPSGSVPTAAWTPGDTAVFSAGNDATNAYTVTLGGEIQAGGITFKNGLPTITGGTIRMTNDFEFPIIANTNAVINSDLQDLAGSCGWKKTGSGKLTLGGTGSFNGGVNIVAEGILGFTHANALGSTLSPTVVSNGATLEMTTSVTFSEPVVLNGFGANNSGALCGKVGSAAKTSPRTGATVIDSDTRINYDGTTATWWYWGTGSNIKTNGVNNANLYIGGGGNVFRLDIPGPCIDIGDGVLYKDGAVQLRFETGARAKELRWSAGGITSRVGANFLNHQVSPGVLEPATIYVSAGAGQFLNSAVNQTLSQPFVIAAGANPVFRPTAGFSITLNAVISGEGGLSKYNDTGTVNLNATNTYSGNTIILGGNLVLGANGSIFNSAVIDVRTNAVFNVSANAGGFVLQSNQKLTGSGSVTGDVTANGTLSPGTSLGTLTFNNNLTIAGNLLVEVNRTASPSNDMIAVTGMLANAGTGTLTVTNIGWSTLRTGDTFQIFNQSVQNGSALTVVSAGGITWSNRLADDGSIVVLSAPAPVEASNLSLQPTSPTNFLLSALGAPNSTYGIFACTNVTAPAASWSLFGITNASPAGVIHFVVPQGTNQEQFFWLSQ